MSSPASTSCAHAQGRAKALQLMVTMGRGGSRLPNFGPGESFACPFGPPRLTKAPPGLCSRIMVIGTFLVDDPHHAPPLCSLFPDEPGRGLKSRRRHYLVRYGKPGTARSIAAVRKGSPVKMLSLAASPRPQHRSPFLARQPASLLLAWTREVGGLVNADGGGGSLPYTPPECTRSATSAL